MSFENLSDDELRAVRAETKAAAYVLTYGGRAQMPKERREKILSHFHNSSLELKRRQEAKDGR